MARFKSWISLLGASIESAGCPGHFGIPVILDTADGSENAGDLVIMDACNHIVDDLFPGRELKHVPTHYYTEELEQIGSSLKILCGTNILYTCPEGQMQWAMPQRLSNIANTCLLGVGMSDIGIDSDADFYSRQFYRTVLSSSAIHSVRDSRTKDFLNGMGIQNVVNTACPTMWSLTEEVQDSIVASKSDHVLTSITDYAFDPNLDLIMLETLRRQYERVTIWVQGSHDIDWCLGKILNLEDWNLIGPDLADLDSYIEHYDYDYVGTRLHAGIRCLNGGHRSLVVAVDNRARQIGRDTNLPVVEREKDFREVLEGWIKYPQATRINIPWGSIDAWKNQFSKGL